MGKRDSQGVRAHTWFAANLASVPDTTMWLLEHCQAIAEPKQYCILEPLY